MIAILSLMSVIDAPESAKTCKYLASIIIAIITAPKWLFADPSEIAARVVTVNSSSPVSSTVMLMLMHECSNVSVICLIRCYLFGLGCDLSLLLLLVVGRALILV